MDKQKLIAAIAALEAADEAQQEALPACEFCYELHTQLQNAIDELAQLLEREDLDA
jgi:hypothetical protein